MCDQVGAGKEGGGDQRRSRELLGACELDCRKAGSGNQQGEGDQRQLAVARGQAEKSAIRHHGALGGSRSQGEAEVSVATRSSALPSEPMRWSSKVARWSADSTAVGTSVIVIAR